MTAVTAPGVYPDLTSDVYHADPVPDGSLSVSGARRLLPPSCPARFAYQRDNPPTPTATFDLGHAAHRLVLGDGPDLAVVDAADWRTKAAKEARDQAHADGQVPLLQHEHDQVAAMADTIRAHPVASALFDAGTPEQSLFWTDDRTGIWRRARLDWLPDPTGGRLLVPDYKTTRSASPRELERSIYTFGYHQQAAWYLDGIKACGRGDDAVFLFVFQEKDPPYLVTVAQLDGPALRIGAQRNRDALGIYARCVETGTWPGYSEAVELLSLPGWAEAREAA